MNDCLNDMFDIVPSLPKKVEKNTDKIQILENKLKILETKFESVEKMTNEHNRKIKNIASKIQDLNILELFKNSSGENGEDSNMISIINNLDKKISSKVNFIDEKMKKIEEINYKSNRDVQNIINSADLNKRNFNNMKQNQENLENKLNNMEKNFNLKYNEIFNKFSEKLNSLERITKEKKLSDNKLMSNLESNKNNINIISSMKEEKKEEPKISIENKEKINDIINHINEIDKYLKSIPHQIGIDQIKLDINSLKSSIGNCSTLNDLKETKEREEELQKQITFLREQFDDYNADQTDHEDLQNIKRKVELFSNKIYDLDNSFQELLTKKNLNLEKNKHVIDSSKFLEIKVFEEFKNQIIKEFNNVNDNFNHLRKLIDNILDSLKNKTSFKDIKILEDDILTKLEDLKLTNAKKYAERIETIKNIKYLDQQIKQIIQYYIKKNDKDNNWLIAKKPLNGNLCASCEAYIGDLKDNTNYIPWNKYPNRDVEKLYRLGNGFSKMLQMIQIDENDKKNVATSMQNNDGTIEGNNLVKEENMGKTAENPKKNLPKIKSNMNQTRSYFHTVSNINTINPEEDNNNIKKINAKEAEELNTQPKITKIYRLNKES